MVKGKKIGTFILYVIVSISSFIIDQLLFRLFRKLFSIEIVISTILARIVSSLYNYFLNRDKVFKSKETNYKTMLKYYLLVIVAMFLSGISVKLLNSIISIDESIIKMFVDSIIFIINYYVQKLFIFKISQ